MPNITINWLNKNLKHENICEYYPIFIETGTYQGDTILPLEINFQELHTIEIKEDFFLNVRKKYNSTLENKKKKINFHLGDSSIILTKICPKINNNAIFFLDGHWSSGNTGRGNKDCPIYEELESIMLHHSHNSIIIIDDCRLFGKGPHNGNCKENWEEINIKNILKIVNSRIENHYFAPSELDEKDRLIIFLKQK